MARFQFRLERVLRVRAVQEEAARAAWLDAERAAAESEELHDRDAALLEAASRALREAMPSSSAAALLRAHEALDRMSRTAVRRRELARTLRLQSQQAREPWERRRREVRGLEQLAARALEEHRRSERAAEARSRDEFINSRATRAVRAENKE